MSTIARNWTPRALALDVLFRRALMARLAQLENARIEVEDPAGRAVFGRGPAGLAARLVVGDTRFYRKAGLGGSLGAAESYIQGDWETDDLTALVRVFARNIDVLDRVEKGPAALAGSFARIPHWFKRNSPRGSRRNIAAHYDLGNEFFETFLDRHGMYSSATYLNPDDTLERASTEKLDRVCRKLGLGPRDSVVEIGSGWGGFACYAASRYGCRITTTTISREQYEAARRRVKKAGLEDKVTVLNEDYRSLRGVYDKLVSIEMIEAVGHQYLSTYLSKCADLLKQDGLALIQAITIEDHRYRSALRSVDFIKRYIFPGSFIPCVSAIVASAGRSTDLRLINLEDQGDSYAKTIHDWRRRFESNLPQIRQMGYDERFIRMWRFYLAYCEGGFLERTISNVQLLFAKPRSRFEQWLAA